MKPISTFILFLSLTACALQATPTSLFWTNCTTGVQPIGTINYQVYNYTTLLRGQGKGSSFSPDLGASLGLLSVSDFNMEVGVDYIAGSDNDFFFNTKIGIEENKLFTYAPSMSVGMFGIGTKPHRTYQDVVDVIVGKSLPDPIGGSFYVGGYNARKSLGKNRQGVMVGYDRPFYAAKDKNNSDYYKWHFIADYASGKNLIGGGGFALAYYFAPDIWVETGPVWFNSQKLNGVWKWSIQLNLGGPAYPAKYMTW